MRTEQVIFYELEGGDPSDPSLVRVEITENGLRLTPNAVGGGVVLDWRQARDLLPLLVSWA